MRETFRPIPEDEQERVVAFLAGNAWPYHGVMRPDVEQARKWVSSGRFRGAHWIEVEGEAAGLINVEEVEDFTPIFDLRIAEACRRRGLGRCALGWLARHVFETLDKTRVEGHTRADNVAMRRLFESCGWEQEAHHRCAWPDETGEAHDSVAYALLRKEWMS